MKKYKGEIMKKVIKILIVALVIIFIVILALLPHLIMGELLSEHMDVEKINLEELMAKELILTTDDNLDIKAWMIDADNAKATVIILSGIEKPSVTAFKGYSRFLRENGYSSLLIEMRAHGDSEGERVALGMEEYLDVKAGVEYIKGIDREMKIIVWGTSMGASTAIVSAGRIEEIDGVISCSAYSSWTDVFCDHIESMGVPKVLIYLERPFVDLYISIKYGVDKLKISPKNEIINLNNRPILLAHSTEDSQIPFSSYQRISEKINDGNVKRFVRNGDEHFIYLDEYFEHPELDKEFSEEILEFLSDNFD